MRYAADQKLGLAVLMGPVGVGKTTIAHQLQQAWARDETKIVGFLPGASVRSTAAFLRLIAAAFGLPTPYLAEAVRNTLERFLLDSDAAGVHPVLLIDEGQSIHSDNIDTLSSLTNFQTPTAKLITVVILAQDNFPNKTRYKEAFRSRIAVAANLDPLSFEEMRGLIDHRLKTAGGTDAADLFDKDTLIAIYNTTKGIPRDVCVLCDNLLMDAFVKSEKRISAELVAFTLSQLGRHKQWQPTEVSA